MVMLIIGIAIGAAFSKFWIMLYNMASTKIKGMEAAQSTTTTTVTPTTTTVVEPTIAEPTVMSVRPVVNEKEI